MMEEVLLATKLRSLFGCSMIEVSAGGGASPIVQHASVDSVGLELVPVIPLLGNVP